MNWTQVLGVYLHVNLLAAVAGLSWGLATFFLARSGRELPARRELVLHYRILLLVAALTLSFPWLPRGNRFTPPVKVWAAPSLANFSERYRGADRRGYLSVATPFGTSTVAGERMADGIFLAAVAIFLGWFFFLARDAKILWAINRRAFRMRQIGRVVISVSDAVEIPFCYATPKFAFVVVPSTMVERREVFRAAVFHELQHHRQRDPRDAYWQWTLKMVCVANPVVHAWIRRLRELQEFACDEALVDRKKVESRAYARCLVEAATSAFDHRRVPGRAPGFTSLVGRNLLKRRVEKMLAKKNNRPPRSTGAWFAGACALLLGVTAFSSHGLVQDRRVTVGQAEKMAARARRENGFPIVVNDRVLAQLNRFVGTPEGRQYMQGALRRMEDYRGTLDEYLGKYQMPEELRAMPIIESGYKNSSEKETHSPLRAAGLWQFIPSTARNFGLRVDAQKDERLNVAVLTDAAMRYLQASKLRFNDWQLSVLAFNMGEDGVQKGINNTGSRDPWVLIAHGFEGDKDYLPKFIAAILIMKNPESVS